MSSVELKTKISREQYTTLFIRFLSQGDYKTCAAMAWPWFQQNEWTDKIWRAIETHPRLCIMGHGSASKTFTASIWFLLDWIAYANTTALVLTSSTVPSMDRRIWADFKTLWTKSRVNLSSIAQILDAKRMIRMSITEGKAAIHAVAAESDNAETKIQGMHMPRNRVIIDEADNPYSSSIWPALTNLGTSGDLRFVALANPVDKNSEFGFNCEPKDGWDSIDPETDFEWKGKLGCHVLRLDGLQSPNLKEGHDKYPFLLSNASVNETRDNKGTNSPEWWTMIRAFYPPEGLITSIFPSGLIEKCSKVIVWYTTTEPIAALDPAFEGGDTCVLTLGRMGRLGHDPMRTCVHIQEQIAIKRKDMTKPLAYDYADQIIAILKNHNVKPENFAIDTTGNQSTFADVFQAQFGNVMRVSFGGAASDRKITNEDTTKASDRFKNFVTELWYVAREWCRLGLVQVSNAPRDLRIQLESRQYHLVGKNLIQAEPKKDMKARGLTSPDCFIAGTMILTDKGERSIEEIQEGEMIQTPFGSSPVIKIHKTETSILTSVNFTNGKTLTGKGAHKIFTWDKGWVRLDSLCLKNQIESDINIPIWNILNLLFTRKRNIIFKHLVDTIAVEKGRKEFYIELSGKSTTAIYLKVMLSIIKMVIGLIAESKTLSLWKEAIINACTWLNASKILSMLNIIKLTWLRLSQKLLNGIAPKLALHGIGNMERTVWLKEKSILASARYALGLLIPSGSQLNSAPRNVETRNPSFVIKLKELVRFAWQGLWSLSSGQQKPVHASAPRSIAGKPVEVYNLTLADHNVYYANGVLVQNCADSMVILIHLARVKALGFIPGTFGDQTPVKHKNWLKNSSVFNAQYGIDDNGNPT